MATRLVTNVVDEVQLRKAQLRALRLFCNTVKGTYGPMGEYTAYSLQDPNNKLKAIVSYYTKDGFTVLKHVDTDKPIESLLKDDIRTICTHVIKSIGDGTTSATMLSYYIFEGLLTLQYKKKLPKRRIIKAFKAIIKEGISEIESNGRKCTIDDIYNIAYTSLNGNEEMATIIKNIYKENGMNVFIDVSASNTKDTVVKTYNSLAYEAGYIDPCFINNEKDNTADYRNPHIYIFESPIDTPDMINTLRLIFTKEVSDPIAEFNKLQAKGETPEIGLSPVLIICPYISRDANSFIDQLIGEFTNMKIAQRPQFCIVANIDNDNGYLLDIMKLTDAKFIKKYIDKKTYEIDKKVGLAPSEINIRSFAGTAERVVVDALTTKIINPLKMYDENGNYTEFYTNYVNQLEDLLKKYEETREEIVKIGKLKRRINIIKANMVDLYVGGIGTTDRMALSDSVEDAVLNCRSAAADGVGYAANYEGLRAFNKILNRIDQEFNKADAAYEEDKENTDKIKERVRTYINKEVATVITKSYIELCKQIYLPYCDEEEEDALSIVGIMLAGKDLEKRKPFNILTEEYDDKVLTSIRTEPAILEAISRIITTLFNTNQFLVPDPRFNIYEMEEDDEKVKKEKKEQEELKKIKEKLEELAKKKDQTNNNNSAFTETVMNMANTFMNGNNLANNNPPEPVNANNNEESLEGEEQKIDITGEIIEKMGPPTVITANSKEELNAKINETFNINNANATIEDAEIVEK